MFFSRAVNLTRSCSRTTLPGAATRTVPLLQMALGFQGPHTAVLSYWSAFLMLGMMKVRIDGKSRGRYFHGALIYDKRRDDTGTYEHYKPYSDVGLVFKTSVPKIQCPKNCG